LQIFINFVTFLDSCYSTEMTFVVIWHAMSSEWFTMLIIIHFTVVILFYQ
jgi:hypothetical protein